MTPFPEAMLKPGRTLGLRLNFLDADDVAWQRHGSHLAKAERTATDPPPGSESLTLVLGLIDLVGKPTQGAESIRGGVRGLLQQALADLSSNVLDIHDRVRQPDDLARHIVHNRAAWSFRTDFVGSVHDATLTGALYRFNRDPESGLLNNDQAGGDVARLWDQTCATMIAITGVTTEGRL